MNLWVSLAFVLLFVSCKDTQVVETKADISNAKFEKIPFEKIQGFKEDNLTLAFDVFKKDCNSSIINKALINVCENTTNYTNGYKFFIENFEAFKLLNDDNSDNGLITGYYEPLLNGSLVKTKKFKYPIYAKPDDLLIIDLGLAYPELKKYKLRGKIQDDKVVPYEVREDFDSKEHPNIEVICYVDSKIDRFILEIQGSGRVKLQDETIINVGYAEQNGRAYYPIGNKLIQNNQITRKNMSLQSITKWCEDNPLKVDELFNLNQSKIFFVKNDKTATGSLNIPLVAKRNLAVDTKFIPLGFPVFINTTNPITNNKINQLMVSADTGGAIKGKIRADFFWGNGEEAKQNAGKMAQKGKLIIFIPKDLSKKSRWLNDTSKYLKVKENP
jgi:membrane-bound lytic murein transglycosylase A